MLGAVKGLSSVLHGSPSKLVFNANEAVSNNIGIHSLFYGLLSCSNNSIQFVNTGFAYPIIVRKNVARYLKFSTSRDNKNLHPRKITVQLHPNDFFIIITEGIVNLKNRGAQTLGLKRVMDHLSSSFKNPAEIIDSLNKLADDFLDGLEKREDISIIAIKIEG